jgi:hypothetical protein
MTDYALGVGDVWEMTDADYDLLGLHGGCQNQ